MEMSLYEVFYNISNPSLPPPLKKQSSDRAIWNLAPYVVIRGQVTAINPCYNRLQSLSPPCPGSIWTSGSQTGMKITQLSPFLNQNR